jgi:hypothetical protein
VKYIVAFYRQEQTSNNRLYYSEVWKLSTFSVVSYDFKICTKNNGIFFSHIRDSTIYVTFLTLDHWYIGPECRRTTFIGRDRIIILLKSFTKGAWVAYSNMSRLVGWDTSSGARKPETFIPSLLEDSASFATGFIKTVFCLVVKQKLLLILIFYVKNI